jgi:tRNA(Arg) A34 adenosine deaminase TadA
MNEHQQFIDRCFELGQMAAAEGESPVGSVVVKDGEISPPPNVIHFVNNG